MRQSWWERLRNAFGLRTRVHVWLDHRAWYWRYREWKHARSERG